MIKDYKVIFDEASDAMILSEGNSGRINDVNKACCDLLGYEKQDLLRFNITDLFDDSESKINVGDKTFMYGPVINGRKVILENNKLLTTDITINTIVIDNNSYILTTLRDATDRIAVENELKQLNATKDKFFSIIAHDLKNPLMALTGYSEILDEEIEELETSDIKQYAGSIKKLSKNLSNLIENLLSWARIQTEKISFEPEMIKLRPIIDNILALCLPAIEQKDLTVKNYIDLDFEINCDWNMINTVIRNLVTNAIKFTPNEGEIVISNSSDEFYQIINIKDSGVGMSEQEITKLFKIEKHYTKQGTNRERGTGLGLLLCKEFVDRHKGEIIVNSIEGNGSEFKVKLPVR